MKILQQIYKDYFPPVRGGIEGHINLLANGIRKRGHDVEVLVSNRTYRLEDRFAFKIGRQIYPACLS